MSYKRILCIDGGGIKGVYPAAFLAELEKNLGRPVYEYFDLIAGTSTGGIIALGLGLGFPAGEILKFYTTYGPTIFSGNRYVLKLRQLFRSKYGPKELRSALDKTFGNKTLGEAGTRLLITSMNADNGETVVFKTAHSPKFKNHYLKPVVEIAMATAAAPTYFPIFKSSSEIPYIDGGVWANNPITAAVIEAVGTLGWPVDNIKVLSLGCTYQPFDIGKLRSYQTGYRWAVNIVDTFMRGQSSGALAYAYNLIGRDNVSRIDELVPAKRFELDSAKKIGELQGLAVSRATGKMNELKEIFFKETKEPFVPYTK